MEAYVRGQITIRQIASLGGKGRSREQIAELVREFQASGLTQRKFSENRGIASSELQRSLKIVRRASEPQLMAVQIEAAERYDRAPELMVGEAYRN